MTLSLAAAFALSATLAFTPSDARFAWKQASDFVSEHTPRDAGTPRGHAAASWISARAGALGAPVGRDVFTAPAPGGTGTFVNVYAAYAVRTNAPWTVFVSHFDTKPGLACPGANDGAATTGLLLALVRVFARTSPPSNVMLLWTDAEECAVRYGPSDGLQGSRRAAAELRRRGYDIRAVVVLDMLGDADLGMVLPANGDARVKAEILCAARRAGCADRVRTVPYGVTDDHVPFLEAGFPAADLIDFEYGGTPGANDYWHTPADTMDKVSSDSLLAVGRLATCLLSREPGGDRRRSR